MIIYSQLCDWINYTPDTPSKVAVQLPAAEVGVKQSFECCLYLQIGVEKGDLQVLTAAASKVRRIVRMTQPRSLLINGFASLAAPRNAADPEQARAVLEALATRPLSAQGLAIDAMPFGWNKTIESRALSGEWQQRVTFVNLEPRPTVPAAIPHPRTTTPTVLGAVDGRPLADLSPSGQDNGHMTMNMD